VRPRGSLGEVDVVVVVDGDGKTPLNGDCAADVVG
jgi:hypothetical protein